MKPRDSGPSYRSISRKLKRQRGHQNGILILIALIAILLVGLIPALSLWKNRQPDDSVLLLVGKSIFYLALPFVILYLFGWLFSIIANIILGFRKGSRIKIEQGDYAGQTGIVMEKHEWFYSKKLRVKLDDTGQETEIHSAYCKKTGFLSWRKQKPTKKEEE